MPRRTNVFQEVVAIIHRHMADGAEVTESAMLTDRLTGQEREVDAVIRTSATGYEVIVSIEANARNRPASVEWVEQQVAKHETLPTNQLVLVSQAGFTRNALLLAERRGVPALTPEALEIADADRRIVSKLRSIWPKVVTLTPRRIGFKVEQPDGETVGFLVAEDQLILLEDGTEVANPLHLVRAFVQENFQAIVEQMGVRDIAEDVETEFDLVVDDPGRNATNVGLFVRREFDDGSAELHRIARMAVQGDVAIHVAEVQLTHSRLGSIDSAYGEAQIAGRKALLVVTEDDEGGKLTMRIRPPDAQPVPPAEDSSPFG